MNALYDFGREGFLKGTISWTTDNIKVILINVAQYTVNLTNDRFISDVPNIAKVATSPILSNRTATAGVADANDVMFNSVVGDTVSALVIFKDTGTASTSPLIAYIDTAAGLPETPNGSDIGITWSNATNKIFKL